MLSNMVHDHIKAVNKILITISDAAVTFKINKLQFF